MLTGIRSTFSFSVGGLLVQSAPQRATQPNLQLHKSRLSPQNCYGGACGE